MTSTGAFEQGSFRDREGRIVYREGRVLRVLSRRAAEAWEALAASRFFARETDSGRLVRTRRLEIDAAEIADLVGGDDGHWDAVLEHERLRWISYPYEWPFAMLRDAALLQLDLLLGALRENLIAKDATPYNVQWRGIEPVFIDLASFEPRREGDPWVGYRQFCELFLYPLLLTAYRDIEHQPRLRGALDGIPPGEMDRLFGWRDRLRAGVFADVYLQARLEERAHRAEQARPEEQARPKDHSLRGDLRRAGFKKEFIEHNLRRLRKIVAGLRWKRANSTWASYASTCSYGDEDREVKEAFVLAAAKTVARGDAPLDLVWDLGANTGHYSRLLAPRAELVVALDADVLAVEHHYRALREDPGAPRNIQPLVMNLADPSPALGWRHAERKTLEERGRPELVLALALVHHLSIGNNVPLAEIVAWLAGLGEHLVVEFVHKDDPMVRCLLRNKDDIYHDYSRELFERELARHGAILDRKTFHRETRTLYHLRAERTA